MARARYFVLLALLTLGCRGSQSRLPVVTIPRYEGNLDTTGRGYLLEMKYDPLDEPVAWPHPDTLLIAHLEQYSSADVFSHTCEGSGFFRVELTGAAGARAISLGDPACRIVGSHEGFALAPRARVAVGSLSSPINRSVLIRMALDSGRLDTLGTDCRFYGNPAIAADEHTIAIPALCAGRGRSEWQLYLVETSAGGLHPIPTDSGCSAAEPGWDPTARQITFTRDCSDGRDFAVEVAITDLTGDRRRSVARGYAPVWSPDGRWIACLHTTYGTDGGTVIRLVRPDGTSDMEVFRSRDETTYTRGWGPRRDGEPTGRLVWSPDSRWIAFSRRYDRGTSVWRVNIESHEAHRITRHDR